MSLKYLLKALFVASATAQYGGGGDGSGGWGSWGPSSSAAAAAPTASAQTASSAGPGELIVQLVSVSDTNGSLKYFPDSVQAPIGSIVQFQFHPKNHTITESSFANPCQPVAANVSTPTRPGLKSGFVPMTGTESSTPVFNILINDTKPIWIYCGQTNHCQKGMSMVINQNLSSTDKTIEAYKAAAALLPLKPVANATTSSTTTTTGAVVATVSPATSSISSSTTTTSVAFSTTTSVPTVAPSTAVAATSTGAAAPAVFTGAAGRPQADAYGAGSVAGLVFAGLAALL